MSDGSEDADVVPVICGPTAAGKSAIAMELATRNERAIVAADSRQVYRRFDIGTAKPTAADRERVRHFGIDATEPTDRYSAARWSVDADQVIEAEVVAGRPPIVVGGTGMYLRALFDGLFAEPVVDENRRSALTTWLDDQSTDELHRWTMVLDPERADLGRVQLIRAIAVAMLTGVPISRLHKTEARSSRWRPRYLVVDPGQALTARIDRRFDRMIEAGWIEEVRALGDVADDAPAWKATGYRVLRDVGRGLMTMNRARELILIETRQYAKRQRTWFRHQLSDHVTTRVNPDQSDAAAVIASWWTSVQPR